MLILPLRKLTDKELELPLYEEPTEQEIKEFNEFITQFVKGIKCHISYLEAERLIIGGPISQENPKI